MLEDPAPASDPSPTVIVPVIDVWIAQMAGDWLSRIAMSYLIVPGDFVDLRDERSIAEVPDLILNGLRG